MLIAGGLLMIGMLGPVNILAYGAKPDGETKCTKAIQRAIDEAARTHRRTILVPAGHFLTGTLRLRSHCELHLAKGAVLLGSANLDDYRRGVWYGLIIAGDAVDVALTGPGIIDGRADQLLLDVKRRLNAGLLKIPPHSWRPSELDRPEILEFNRCRNVRIEGVTLKHSICWVETYRDCVGLSIRGIHVDSKTYWNNDGMDVVDCRNVDIANCDIDSDDDGICLKSDDPKARCENVTIKNCRVRSSASAIKFGTSSNGGFRNVKIDGIRIYDTFRSAVALESVDGGSLEDVKVSHVRARNTGNAFFIRLGRRATNVPAGKVENVVLADFDVEVPAGQPDAGYPFQGPQYSVPHNINPASIVGLPGAQIRNVTLKRIRVRMPGGSDRHHAYAPTNRLKEIPERPASYPEFSMFGELPAWALYVRHVRGLKISDVSFDLVSPDYRPPVVFDDVSNARGNLRVRGAGSMPELVRRNCADLSISGLRTRIVR